MSAVSRSAASRRCGSASSASCRRRLEGLAHGVELASRSGVMTTTVPHKLRIRKSCGCAPSADLQPERRLALTFWTSAHAEAAVPKRHGTSRRGPVGEVEDQVGTVGGGLDEVGVGLVDAGHPGAGRRQATCRTATCRATSRSTPHDSSTVTTCQTASSCARTGAPGRAVEQQVVALGDHQAGRAAPGSRRPAAAPGRGSKPARSPRALAGDRSRASRAAYPSASKVSGAPFRSSSPRRVSSTSARWKPSIGTTDAAVQPRRRPRQASTCRQPGAPVIPSSPAGPVAGRRARDRRETRSQHSADVMRSRRQPVGPYAGSKRMTNAPDLTPDAEDLDRSTRPSSWTTTSTSTTSSRRPGWEYERRPRGRAHRRRDGPRRAARAAPRRRPVAPSSRTSPRSSTASCGSSGSSSSASGPSGTVEDAENSMAELALLAETAGSEVLEAIYQRRQQARPRDVRRPRQGRGHRARSCRPPAPTP